MPLSRIVVNGKAIDALLRSPEVVAKLEAMGRAVVARAGPGHDMQTKIGRRRARVTVMTKTYEARRAEATDRTLTRAIDAARNA